MIDIVLKLIDHVIEEMKAKNTLNEFSEDVGFDKMSHKIITEVAPRLITNNSYKSQEKALVAKIKRTYVPDNTRTMTRNEAPRLITNNSYTSQEKALVAKIKKTYVPDNTRTMTRNDECTDVMEYP